MAGELEVRVAGVDVTDRVAEHPSIDYAINRRGQARLQFTDRAGIYRPDLFDDVLIYIDSTLVFGGLVQTVGGRELHQQAISPYAAGSRTSVEVTDYAWLVDHRIYNGITPAGPLRAAVAAVVINLTDAGALTLGAGADGPAVPAFGFSFVPVREALDQLCTLAGWTWVIDATRYLWIREGGTVAAPRDLTTADAKLVSLNWQQTQKDYRSHQFVHFGQAGDRPYTMSAVSDGVRTVYPLIGVGVTGEIRPVAPVPTVLVGGVTRTVASVGDPDHDWWYREEPGAVQLEIRPGAPIPAAGTPISATFAAQYPGVVLVAQAGPHVERVATLTTSDDPAVAVATAEALLRQYGVMPRTATLETRWLDFLPGQTVDVDFPAWDLDGEWLIDTVQIRHVLQQQPAPYPGTAQHQWIARLTLVEGDETRGSWLDFWRQAMSGGASGATSVAGTPPGTGGGTTTILGQTIVYLGGCRTTSQMTDGDWYPIVDFVDVLLNAADGAGRTVRCHSWVLDDTMTINVRVVALTDPVTVVGTGIVTSATDQFVNEAFQNFGITLVGHNFYRVEMQVSEGGDGWVAGAVCYPGAWLVAAPPEPPDFPVVISTTAFKGEQPTATTTHPITLPAHVAGDLLLVIWSARLGTDHTNTVTAGWTTVYEQKHSTDVCTQLVVYKIATSSSETLTITSGASRRSTFIGYQITGATGVTGTAANAIGTNHNCPAHTPGGGAANYLWIATHSLSGNYAETAPTDYGALHSYLSTQPSTATTSGASRTLNAASEDPGTWTHAANNGVVGTLAIAP